MSAYKVGDTLKINEQEVIINEKIKGSFSKKINFHSGWLPTGYKRKPCTYILSNGMRLKGETIKKLNNFHNQ